MKFRRAAKKIIKVGTRKIGVFNVDGKYYAMLDTCPHHGASIAKAQSAALICRLMIIVMNLVWTAKSSVAHGTAGNSKSKPANVSATQNTRQNLSGHGGRRATDGYRLTPPRPDGL